MVDEHGSILDIDTSDAIEPQAVEAGEYKVRITGFRKDNDGNIVRTTASGGKYFILSLDIPDEPASKGMTHFMSVPDETMDAKRSNGVKWQLELLKRAFALTEINFDAMIGAEGFAMLAVETTNDYGEQNRIQKFIAGA